ncbi:MAG: type II toxin-antitoxin system VapC family toxin [Candidatus Scalindua sp.]
MKKSVLDSYAIITFLFKEEGHEKVLKLFEWATENDVTNYITSPNWAEVRYIVQRKVGARKWEDVRQKLLRLPFEVVPADQALAELAGEIKASYKMSLADCFAAAFAKMKKLEVYTGDPEFQEVESDIKIVWL